jgi:AAA15 family ATPase/GTPase
LWGERVVEEYLLVYEKSKPQTWFKRSIDENNEDYYTFGSSFKGRKEGLKSETRQNCLFLSMAVQQNNKTLLPIFNWICHQLIIVSDIGLIGENFLKKMIKDDLQKQRILSILKSADINISDIHLQPQKGRTISVTFDDLNYQSTKEEESIFEYFQFIHKNDENIVAFTREDESTGTILFLNVMSLVFHCLDQGGVLLIDEMDSNLHSLLIRNIIALFHHSKVNPKGAQLIFTTHDTSLLNAYGLFRRDQIWFTEKDADQRSTLYGLSDFHPRKNESLEKG